MWKSKFSHIDITFAHPTALLSLSVSSTVVTFLLSNLCSSLSIMLSNLLHLEQSPIHLFLKVHLYKTPLHQFPCLFPNSIESREFWDVVQNICQFQAEIFLFHSHLAFKDIIVVTVPDDGFSSPENIQNSMQQPSQQTFFIILAKSTQWP